MLKQFTSCSPGGGSRGLFSVSAAVAAFKASAIVFLTVGLAGTFIALRAAAIVGFSVGLSGALDAVVPI